MTTLYEEVRATLRAADFRPKKSRGQNFLIHEHVIEKIVQFLDLAGCDQVVEIGPGLGFLTRRLLERAAKVFAVEVDPELVARLRQAPFATAPKLELIHDDILTVALPEILPRHKVKLAGNLPYSIATPVLFRVFEWYNHFSMLVLMLQKEVADRLASAADTEDYGSLAVWCQVHGRIREKISVSPEAFFPRPSVRSTVLKIELHEAPLVRDDERAALRCVVRAAFNQRRKTLANALSAHLHGGRSAAEDLLREIAVDTRRRGETLSVDEFIALARAARQRGILAIGG